MDLSPKDAIFAGTLGALVGILYAIGRTTWGDGSIADLAALDVLASACIGAVAGILAFMIRQRM
jgi:hypothetical protein